MARGGKGEMFPPHGAKVHSLTLAASTELHNSKHVKEEKAGDCKNEGKDRRERETEKKGEEGMKPDDVMHFIVREGDQVSRANITLLFSFLSLILLVRASCRATVTMQASNFSRCGKLALFGIPGKSKGRKEAARAKIPHQVFIKPRLMWSQQQPLKLRLSARKAEYEVSHFEA